MQAIQLTIIPSPGNMGNIGPSLSTRFQHFSCILHKAAALQPMKKLSRARKVTHKKDRNANLLCGRI